MYKTKYFLMAIIITIFEHNNCFSLENDPPFSEDIFLDYKGSKIILGYSTLDDITKVFGNPEETEFIKHGGEGFDWKNMIANDYFDKRLTLIFSSDKNRLIRIIFSPKKGDNYSLVYNINEKSNRTEILNLLDKKQMKISYASNSTTFWVDFFMDDNITVAGGFQFNEDQTLHALNLFIDAPW